MYMKLFCPFGSATRRRVPDEYAIYDYVEADQPTRESVLEAMSGVEGAEAILDEAGEIVVREEPSIT